MDNPYRVPESDPKPVIKQYSPSVLWKMVFFIYLLLVVWGQYETFFQDQYEDPVWLLILLLIVDVVYLAGLFGLAFAKKLGTSGFWICFLVILVMVDFYNIYYALWLLERDLNMELDVLAYAMVLGSMIPLFFITWWSTYRYSRIVDHFGTNAVVAFS